MWTVCFREWKTKKFNYPEWLTEWMVNCRKLISFSSSNIDFFPDLFFFCSSFPSTIDERDHHHHSSFIHIHLQFEMTTTTMCVSVWMVTYFSCNENTHPRMNVVVVVVVCFHHSINSYKEFFFQLWKFSSENCCEQSKEY